MIDGAWRALRAAAALDRPVPGVVSVEPFFAKIIARSFAGCVWLAFFETFVCRTWLFVKHLAGRVRFFPQPCPEILAMTGAFEHINQHEARM
jgi:hypothetical protein